MATEPKLLGADLFPALALLLEPCVQALEVLAPEVGEALASFNVEGIIGGRIASTPRSP